jgi:hypothetical protein
MKSHYFFTSAVLATLAFTPLAQAATVLGVSVQSTSGNSYKSILDPEYSRVASSFTTGSGPGWTLNSATFTIDSFEVNDLSAYIYDDNLGIPGTVQATVMLADVPALGINNVTFDFSASGLTLNPNTSYWLAIEQTTGASAESSWARPDSTYSTTGLPGWTIGGELRVNANPNWEPITPHPGLFSIEVTAIPEPSSSVALLALGGLALLRRRR